MEAVLAATSYLTRERWNKKTVLDMDPQAQVIIMEYTGTYQCHIVGVVGLGTVQNIKVTPPEKPEEKQEKNLKELSKENIEKFKENYCRLCGTQRCTGCGEWLRTCREFRESFGEISLEKLEEIL